MRSTYIVNGFGHEVIIPTVLTRNLLHLEYQKQRKKEQKTRKQESIPVRCVPPASGAITRCQYQWGVYQGGGYTQVTCPLVYPPPWYTHPPDMRDLRPGISPERHLALGIPIPWTDTRLWKHYLPTTSMADGNKPR